MEEDLKKKAVLTLGGGVRIPDGFVMPFRISHSTAGPGAGFGSAVFAFGKFRVKKAISYTAGEFELVPSGDGYRLDRGGRPFLDDVRIEPVVRHSPEQAFFNLDPRCMFRCAYCNSPRLDPSEDKHLSVGKVLEMIRESMQEYDVRCVSFTSGVVGSIDETVGRIADAVRAVRTEYPYMRIGVEPYVSCRKQIELLRNSGADEIKINLETPDRDIFAKVCPDLDFDGIWSLLRDASEIFGRWNVISNIIYGMGESDELLERTMDRMCSMGVIPGLRALRLNTINIGNMENAVGVLDRVSPERAIGLAEIQKRCLEKYGLSHMPSRTMCMECGCCDLIPFRDFRFSSWRLPEAGRICMCPLPKAPRIRRFSDWREGIRCKASGAKCRMTIKC